MDDARGVREMTTPATHYLGHTISTARIERFAAAHDYALQRRLDREDAVAAKLLRAHPGAIEYILEAQAWLGRN